MTDTWYIFVGPGVHEVVFICVAIVDSIWTLAINNNSVILSLGVDAVTESFLPIVSVIWNHVQTRNGLQSILGDVNLPYKVKQLHQEAVPKKPTHINWLFQYFRNWLENQILSLQTHIIWCLLRERLTRCWVWRGIIGDYRLGWQYVLKAQTVDDAEVEVDDMVMWQL